ncbi:MULTISPECIES: mechanosensitive ion channel family protein [Thermococcus]|uniref:mechanosensitive ion channel family protein n=1 Tax=Thermococcus TaxID=2263 RepID=UPI0014314751|nr:MULTISPECIES: mechanosensitive ion channel family protein [Thermococcus]NJE49309.1 mechanosensitive ion channel family protein [Thermococcus sp. 9N3]CAI1492305.1 Small-conductance mechanosensitive channel [Thermococcus nautili]
MNTTATLPIPFVPGITLESLLKAVVTLVVLTFLGEVTKKAIIRASKETDLTWILNEDTAELIFRLFVLGGIIGALYALGVMKYTLGPTTIGNLTFAVGFFYISYLIAKKSKDYLLQTKRGPEDIIKAKLFYYLFITVAFFLSLSFAGVMGELGALLAAAGITGIVLGFSSRTVVANFVSGIFMYFDKPLQIGDAVQVGDVQGVVEDIRILSTRIRTWDGTLVRIPNEALFNSNIVNLQRYPVRRVDVSVGIAYAEDAGRAIEVILKTLDEMPLVLAEPEPKVYVESLGDSSVVLRVWAWAPSERWFDVRTEVVRRIKEALDREGIEIPFPQRVNWFANELRVKLEDE